MNSGSSWNCNFLKLQTVIMSLCSGWRVRVRFPEPSLWSRAVALNQRSHFSLCPRWLRCVGSDRFTVSFTDTHTDHRTDHNLVTTETHPQTPKGEVWFPFRLGTFDPLKTTPSFTTFTDTEWMMLRLISGQLCGRQTVFKGNFKIKLLKCFSYSLHLMRKYYDFCRYELKEKTLNH